MSGVNKVILIGNLGRDPEIFTFDNGSKKASFSLATTEVYKNREGQNADLTVWHNITLYRNLAEIAEQYLRKGQTIYLEGRIRPREYEKEGQKHTIVEILGDNFTMLGGRRDSESGPSKPTSPTNAPEVTDKAEDDLPF